ncbi:Ig-like domain-containing protein [Demequina sp.]|uniref:Ig-like domain-containing protein n=1 Tax=Demequina sp. TaxID=2050685 RepID=UPI003D132EB4
MQGKTVRRLAAASAGLAVAATPFLGAAAYAAPERAAATSEDTTYLADTLGLPAQSIVETVTYDRFQWLLQQPGQFAFVVGSTNDANFKTRVQEADAAAREAGATKLYWFDPNLTGYTDANRKLDVRNPETINLAAASQTIFGNIWRNVIGQYLGNGIQSTPNSSGNSVTVTANDSVVNDSVNPAWDLRTGATPAVSSTDDVFFVYDKDRTVDGVADKVADFVNLSTVADAKPGVTAALATVGGGAAIDAIGQFYWWKDSNNKIQANQNGGTPEGIARYGGDILNDSDNADGWNVKQVTYPELLHLLSIKEQGANFALLFGGTWCPNTRAVIKFVNQEAVENDVTVYNFDLVLDGGKTNGSNGGSNPIHVRDNAASGSTFNFRPSFVYGDLVRTYFANLITQYDPNSGNRVAYYPSGNQSAFPDVVRKLQVPFLIGYERGVSTNPSGTAVKRQWIQQNTDANTGLATFKEYMTNWWFTQPSAQIGLNFAIPADESTLTSAEQSQLAQARANVAFAQEALDKLDVFFGGLPGAVKSTRTVTAPDAVYGADATVALAIANKYGRVPAGVATLSINGAEYPVTVAQNAAEFTVPGLPAGSHPFTITYAADSQLLGFTETGTLTVTKAAVKSAAGAVVTKPTPQKAGSYKVTVTEPSGLAKASGAVTVTLKNGSTTKTATGTVTAGTATIALPKLPAGTWTASVAYAGDANYAAKTVAGGSVVSSKSAVSKVAGAVSKTPTSTKAGAYKVTVSAPAGLAKASGKVTVTLKKGSSKKTVTGTLKSGVVTIAVPKLAKGTWTASVAFAGDANYAAKTAAGASIKVTK